MLEERSLAAFALIEPCGGSDAKSLSYSKEREAFGEKISNFQLIQEKLANMVTEINAARLITIAEGTSEIIKLLIVHSALKHQT